jgi:spore maturation protein CgeB
MSLLFLDCLSGTPFGKIIADEAVKQGFPLIYADARKLPKKIAYRPRRVIQKAFHQKKQDLPYFYFPKLAKSGIKKLFAKTQPRIVFIFGELYTFVDKETILALKKQYHCKLVFFDTESANFMLSCNQFRHFVENELSVYDKIFTFSNKMANYFQNLGLKQTEFFAYGAHPLPILNIPKTKDLLFIGTPDMRRLMTLEALANYCLSVYGAFWKRYHKLLSPTLKAKMTPKDIWGEEINPLLQSSKIILNINKIGWHSIESGINLRVFEALASKSFLLTEYSDEINQMFKIGEELETFKTTEELKEKIDYYLLHNEARERIAQKGYEKFLTLFTWEQRVKNLFDNILEAYPS